MSNSKLAVTCVPGRNGDHAYWGIDGVNKCRFCGTPKVSVPKMFVAGSEMDATTDWAKRTQAAKDEGGFHWRNDIYFKRLPDGVVRVRRFEFFNGTPHAKDWIIPAAEWASIVCSVSADGETGARWNAAQDFHGRQPPVSSGSAE